MTTQPIEFYAADTLPNYRNHACGAYSAVVVPVPVEPVAPVEPMVLIDQVLWDSFKRATAPVRAAGRRFGRKLGAVALALAKLAIVALVALLVAYAERSVAGRVVLTVGRTVRDAWRSVA